MKVTRDFLKNTYWYVPTKWLLAIQMAPDSGKITEMIDQTVWYITDYKEGYFWGVCAALLYQKGEETELTPSSFRLSGSVTTDGKVLISFMPINQLGAIINTVGFGEMKNKEDAWVFEMQMASGSSDLTTHWAFMEQTQPNDSSWKRLPGTNYSVDEFLAAAGF